MKTPRIYDLVVGKTIKEITEIEHPRHADILQIAFTDGTWLQVETSEWIAEARFLTRLEETN